MQMKQLLQQLSVLPSAVQLVNETRREVAAGHSHSHDTESGSVLRWLLFDWLLDPRDLSFVKPRV